MIDALTAAAHILSEDAQKLNTISHNLANVSTNGYKRQRAISVPFQEHLNANAAHGLSPLPTTLSGHVVQNDLRPGTLRTTGQPLDLAIEDAGFFEIKTPQGMVYTRRGDFQIDSQGRLVTHEGYPVMGLGGEILPGTPTPVIDQNGAIFDKDQKVGQIKVIHFTNPESLARLESGVFAQTAETQISTGGYAKVRQGHLESSNVTSMEEMVRMIETMRHFEAGQKIVQGYDEMIEKALKKFGEF